MQIHQSHLNPELVRVSQRRGSFSSACHHPRLTFCSRRIPQTLEGRFLWSYIRFFGRKPLFLGFQKVFKGTKRLPPAIKGSKSDGDWVQEVWRLDPTTASTNPIAILLEQGWCRPSLQMFSIPRILQPLHLHPPVLILPIPSYDFAFHSLQLPTLTMQHTVSRWQAYLFYILVNLDIKLSELLWCKDIIRSIFMM